MTSANAPRLVADALRHSQKEKAAVSQKRKPETKGKGSTKSFRTADTITSDVSARVDRQSDSQFERLFRWSRASPQTLLLNQPGARARSEGQGAIVKMPDLQRRPRRQLTRRRPSQKRNLPPLSNRQRERWACSATTALSPVAELRQMQKKARAPKKAAKPLDSEEEELKKLKVRLG